MSLRWQLKSAGEPVALFRIPTPPDARAFFDDEVLERAIDWIVVDADGRVIKRKDK